MKITKDDTGENFVPSPPINIKRQPRQMPAVEDFPEIGQRELRSKKGVIQSGEQRA